MDDISCIDCGFPLTKEEAHFYGLRCEDCERAGMERLDRWLGGGDAPELDAIFDVR